MAAKSKAKAVLAIDDAESQLALDMAKMSRDPLSYAIYAFPWEGDELPGHKGPRKWQAEILALIRDHLSNPATRFNPLRIAVASGNGIGKSCLIAMLTSWALDTCEDARVQITANTEPQLRTKTWPEVTRWKSMAITSHWWNIGATSIRIKDESHSDQWRADMVTWNEKNPAAFQGLHNERKRILLVYDEASGIPDSIWEASSGSLTDANTEIIWLAFGNPMRNKGAFRECFAAKSHRWVTRNIDARTVEGTNKEYLQQIIEDEGEDSDIARVRVRGIFPREDMSQFISSDLVKECQNYVPVGYEGLPKIIGVDVARGGEDQTSITLRQGRMVKSLARVRIPDTARIAELVIEKIREYKPDAVVVDADGLGAGTFDHLRYRGYTRGVYEFHGAETAHNPAMYRNRRAEVWGLMRDMMRSGMQIPAGMDFERDLTMVESALDEKGRIQLESKKSIKARGGKSPDFGDSLALTFAVNVRRLEKPKASFAPLPFGENSWMA